MIPHPHVFADSDGKVAASMLKGTWKHQGRGEDSARGRAARPKMPRTHRCVGVKAGKKKKPALCGAMEVQRKASSVGFDWNDRRAVLHKSAKRRRDRGRA